jgi:hypothetical protein
MKLKSSCLGHEAKVVKGLNRILGLLESVTSFDADGRALAEKVIEAIRVKLQQ